LREKVAVQKITVELRKFVFPMQKLSLVAVDARCGHKLTSPESEDSNKQAAKVARRYSE